MAVLKFIKNYNRKLDCDYYTTFRLKNNSLRKNECCEVFLDGKMHHRAVCVDIKETTLDKVNDWVAMLDAGVNAKDFKELVKVMYSKYNVDSNTATFVLMLMKKIR